VASRRQHFESAPVAPGHDMERLHDVGSLMRSHADYSAPADVVERAKTVIAGGGYRILD
jgi:hypothetical protein